MCAMTGCSKEGAGEEKAQGKNMLLVDTKWNEEIEYYFIDENLEVKTYSGYQSMGDFEEGLSVVEVFTTEYQGQQLIDAKENVIAQYAKIEKLRIKDNLFYLVMDEKDKKGVLNSRGEVIADCQYSDVYELDDTQTGWEDVIFCKMEDTASDVFDKNGILLHHIPAGYVTSEYGYKGVEFSNVGNIFQIEYGDEKVEVIVEDSSKTIEEQLENVFSTPTGTEVFSSMCDKIFYTQSDEGIKIYRFDNLEEYDGITYRACTVGGLLFYGEEDIIFNENGKAYKFKVSDIGGVAYNGIGFLRDGYVYVNTGTKHYIIDVEGDGTMTEAPYDVQFSSLVSCYQYDGIYYDYSGNEIVNTKEN